MGEDDFNHLLTIRPADLKIEPFKETANVRSFDCGNAALNDFLTTDEVSKYEHEHLGRTYLVYHEGFLVAYFTISTDAIRLEYLRNVKSYSRFSEMRLEAVPGVKIGRLAIARDWQNRGIGRMLVVYIAGMAMRGDFACRLLIVQSKPESTGFYLKCGFHSVVQTARERRRIKHTMYLDLEDIREEASR